MDKKINKKINMKGAVAEMVADVADSSSIKPVASTVEEYYSLILWFLPKLKNFPKEQRHLLADRIEMRLLEILELLTKVTYGAGQAEAIKTVSMHFEQLRCLVMLCKDLKYIPIEQYDHFVTKTVEIERMLGDYKRQNGGIH